MGEHDQRGHVGMPLARHCPDCGDTVENRDQRHGGGRCRGCGREVFANAKPAAGVFLERAGQLAADRERQVDVRPFVASVRDVRTCDRCGRDGRIRLGELEQMFAYAIALPDGEHRRDYRRR